MIRYYATLFTMLIALPVFAQSIERTSLWNDYREIKNIIIKEGVRKGLPLLNHFEENDLSAYKDIESSVLLLRAFCHLQLNQVDSTNYYLNDAMKLIDASGLDSLKATVYSTKGLTYWKTFNYEKAIPFHLRALKIAESYNNNEAIMRLSYYLGSEYQRTSQLDSARHYTNRALGLVKFDKKKIGLFASTLNVLSKIEIMEGNITKAMECIFEAYRVAKSSAVRDDLVRHRYFTWPLQGVYHMLGNLPIALEYVDYSIKKKIEIQNLIYIEGALITKACLLLRMDRLEESEEVLVYLEENYPDINKAPFHYHIISAIKGGLLYKNQEWNAAEKELSKLIPIIDGVDTLTQKIVLSQGLFQLSELYACDKRYYKAINICNRQLQTKFLGYAHKKQFLGTLAACHRALGNDREAYGCLLKRDVVRDTIDHFYQGSFRLTQEHEILEQQQVDKVEALNYENKINQVQTSKQSNLMLFGGFSGLLLLGLLYLWGRQRKLKLENSLVEVKQQLLKLQVNPHFIFNALNSIQNSVLSLNKEKSVELISKFSKLTRQVLQNSDKSMVSIHEELQLLTNYMDLEKVRTQNKFDYEIEIDESIDVYIDEVPSMMLQLFVENAIWHGILPKEEKGLIKVKFGKEENRIKVTIEDDGIGREMSTQIKSKDQKEKVSMGMDLVKQRISVLNRKYKTNIELSVKDGMNGRGTHALLVA